MRKKLLLADDSITIQKVVELTFPSEEFEVVTAGNGRIAVDKAMTFLPDMVLCDVIMPQLDGYQVCEALRAIDQLKNVPILLLNGAFEPYDSERAKSVGALGNVSKPFDPPALVARVKEILAERGTGAYGRPSTDAMPVDAFAGMGKVHEEAKTMDVGAPPAAAHAAYYDETETHPVSTIEVPMNVREMAARSLSLDAPVFSTPGPDVLTTEEPSDFAETLHGPLDADVQAMAEQPQSVETVEEIEAMEEMEPIAATTTSEIEPPAHALAVAAAAAVEETSHAPVEFDSDAQIAEELPSTLPPVHAPAPVAIEEFSGEHEFEPHEFEPHATEPEPIDATAPEALPLPPMPEPEAEPMPAPMAAEPEMMAVPEAAADLEPEPAPIDAEPVFNASAAQHDEPIGLPASAPQSPDLHSEPDPISVAPLTMATAAAVAASSTGLSGLVDLQPEPMAEVPPPSPVATPAMPSAEVAVPVDMVQQIAQRVISQVSERVIREIAWDVIPGLAEKLIKAEIERIKARAESERD